MGNDSKIIVFPRAFLAREMPEEGFLVDSGPLAMPQRVFWDKQNLDDFLNSSFGKKAHRIDQWLVLEEVVNYAPAKARRVRHNYRAWGKEMVFERRGCWSEAFINDPNYVAARVKSEEAEMKQAGEYAMDMWSRKYRSKDYPYLEVRIATSTEVIKITLEAIQKQPFAGLSGYALSDLKTFK